MGHWKTDEIFYFSLLYFFFFKLSIVFDMGTWGHMILLLISKNVVMINESFL